MRRCLRTLFKWAVLLGLCGLLFAAPRWVGQHRNLVGNGLRLADLLREAACGGRSLSVQVQKSACRLVVLCSGKAIKSYPVVFGSDPVNDKQQEGDMRTPEGVFRILASRVHPKWSRFLWLDYPNDLSREKHRKAKADGLIAADAAIGGEIGIHGVPHNLDSLVDLRLHWTRGCISMKNPDVEELYEVLQKHAPTSQVTITP